MAKRKHRKKQKGADPRGTGTLKEVLNLYAKLADLKKEVVLAAQGGAQTEDRLADLEVHVNLLARLLTTLCIERMGIRIGTLKSLVRRIEKEAVRDSQIMELESLYKLSHVNSKKSSSAPSKIKDDPWEQIS